MTRAYDMTNRARSAAQTSQRVAEATEELLASQPIEEVTLQAIADQAGVTVQTVLRHAGSRDGCIRMVGERVERRVRQQREASAPGNVPGAIAGLMEHYESEGRLMLRLLAQEGRDPLAAEAAARGRAYHREWALRCLGPHLHHPSEVAVDALVAATDLYVWKLLRLDLQRSAAAARDVITRLVEAVLEDA